MMFASHTPGQLFAGVGCRGGYVSDFDLGSAAEGALLVGLETMGERLVLPAPPLVAATCAVAILDDAHVELYLWGATEAVIGVQGRARRLAGNGRAEWVYFDIVSGDGVVLGDSHAARVELSPVTCRTLRAGSLRLGTAARRSEGRQVAPEVNPSALGLPAPALLEPGGVATSSPEAPAQEAGGDPFAELWGRTMMRPVEDAAVREPTPSESVPTLPSQAEPAPAPAPREVSPLTVVEQGLSAPSPSAPGMIAAMPPGLFPGASLPVIDGIQVHDGDTIPVNSLTAQDVPIARIRTSAGDVRDVMVSLVIGRSPTPEKGVPDAATLKVESPGRQISQNHVCVRRAGTQLEAIDLGSKNGTRLMRFGSAPVLLAANVPTEVRNGDALDLGDGVVVHIEGPSQGVQA